MLPHPLLRRVTIELRHHYNLNSINLESIHAQYPAPPVSIALGSMSSPCNFIPIILYLIAYRLQWNNSINVSISRYISALMVDLKKFLSLFLVPLILIPSIGTKDHKWHDNPPDDLLYRWGAVLPLWQCQHPVSWKRRENVWCDLLEILQ